MSDLRDLEEKIATARAAREAREAKREDSARAQRLADELEAEERALADLDVLDKIEAEHGPENKRWRKVPTGLGLVVVKRPALATFRKYQDKGKTDSASLDQLVRPCLVHPTKAEFDRIVEQEPAALMRAANAVCYLAGIRKDDASGE
jgi:hypothetical protein